MILLILGVWATWPTRAAAESIQVYQNPLPVKIADPAVLKTTEGEFLYYLAGTGAARFGSHDLVHWQRLDDWIGFDGTELRPNIWAAEAVAHDGRFYYFFAGHGMGQSDRRLVGVSVSDDVDGTFQPHAHPLWEDEYTWIDPHLFHDTDGTPWLLVTNDSKDAFDGKARLYVVELEPDLSALKGELVFLTQPDQPWEYSWQEGPSVILHKDMYYMTWSSHLYASDNYSVGYATAPHPTGPWTKAPENPILSQRIESPAHIGHAGPGHNSFAWSPDGTELFMVYHTRRNSPGGGARHLNIDRVEFQPAGEGPDRLVVPGAPTRTPQPLPAGAQPIPVGGGDEFDGDGLDRRNWPVIYGEDSRWLSVRDGSLRMISLPGDVHSTQTGGSNILLQYPPQSPSWMITTKVSFSPERNYEQAYLTVWKDANNYMMLKHVHADGPRFEAAIEIHEQYESDMVVNEIGGTVWMRIQRLDETRYIHEVSPDGETWQQVGRVFDFPFEHVLVGIGSARAGSPRNLVVPSFDFFRIQQGKILE